MDLDVGRIAARHRVTPRYVQMLFAQTGPFRLAFNAAPSDVRAGIRTEP